MEAKVDIKKLQLLNDRIAQVTDALNQVRLSVHGLTHTATAIGQPMAGAPLGIFQPQLGALPQFPYVAGQPIGFQHTPYYTGVPAPVPFGQLAWQAGLQPPLGSALGLQHTAYSPYVPWFPFPGAGLYHSPELTEQRLIEQRTSDPNRILQTFPFCLVPLSAVSGW